MFQYAGVFPINGRNGYLKMSSGIEVPIYSWSISSTRQRTNYYTSSSENFPVRNPGLISEFITIRGVQYFPYFFNAYEVLGELGWIDWANNRRVYTDIDCVVQRYVMELNYSHEANPSFAWTITLFERSKDLKTLKIKPIAPLNDVTFCLSHRLCERPIYSSDPLLATDADQLVKHIVRATITSESQLPTYATSNSYPRLRDTPGLLNNTLDLIVQGDFDYWYYKLNYPNSIETPDDYKFYYGNNVNTDYFPVQKMKVTDISNFNVNIQTAEMISMNVKLESGRV